MADTRRPVAAAVLAADIVSTAGTEMTTVALPWLVLVTTGSPTRTGGVLAAEFIGLTVLGLVGGRAVAALGARRLMLTADLVRAALIGSVPLLSALHALSYPVLLVVAFAVGGFFPAYQSSQRIVVAAVVGDDELRLTRFGGLQNAVNETASFIGPALGGVLIVVLGPADVLLVDAATYLCAFALVALAVPRPAQAASTEEDGSVRAGLRYLLRHPRLRWEILGIGLIVVGFTALTATLPVLALRGGGGPSAAGWLLGAYGGGSVVGGLIASRATSAGPRPATLAAVGLALSAAALLVPGPLWTTGLAVGLIGVSSGLFFPRFFAAVTAGTPPALRATVLTTVTVVISAPGPIGFLGAGVLNQYAGGRSAGLALVAGAMVLGAVITVAARTVAGRPTVRAADLTGV